MSDVSGASLPPSSRPGSRAGARPGRRRPPRPLTVLALVVVSLALLDVFGAGGPVTALRGAAARVLTPVQEGAARVGAASVAAWRTLAGTDETTRLEADNQRLARQLAEARRAASDEAAARRLATGVPRGLSTVTARVVGLGAARGWSRTATLAAGSRDGVRTDVSVLAADGLVGRVVAVTPHSAVVLLVTDPRFAVGVRTASGRLGVASDGATSLTVFGPAPRVGSRVVTLGSPGGRPFVAGVTVGTVTADRTAPGAPGGTATVRPVVDPGRLDLVAVARPGGDS